MKRLFLAMLVLPMLFIACSQASQKESLSEVSIGDVPALPKQSPVGASSAESMDIKSKMADSSSLQQVPSNRNSTSIENIDWDKKIIKTARVRLEVKNFNAYSQQLRNTIKKFGGYIEREDNFDTDEKAELAMVIKIPVQFFEPLLNELPATDAKQLERNITSEDATGKIIDTQARLETKKATRSKYLEFLKQGKNVEDVLKVQSEINNIQEDIESAEARLSQLTHEARYSTINLSFFEPKSGYNYTDKPNYAQKVLAAFVNGGKWFADLFVGLISIWPLWIGVLLMIVIIKKTRPKNENRMMKTNKIVQ